MSKLRVVLVVALIVVGVLLVERISETSVLATSYDRTAAVVHADAYAHSRSSDYPDYGSGSGCVDCTNYASQVLHQGGLPELEGDDDAWHWYYYKHWWYGWRGSKTWASADWLNTHASQYQGSRFEYKHPSTLESGDFFVMDLATNPFDGPDHARVIVGWGTVEEGDCIGCWRLLANQHCTDRKRVEWSYAIPSNTPLWGWHVVW